MRKSIICLIAACFMGAFFIFEFPEVSNAKSVQDYEDKIHHLEDEKQELQEKETEIEDDQAEVQDKMAKNKENQESAQEELKEIEGNIGHTEEKINNAEQEIEITKEKIATLNDQIEQLKEDIKKLEEQIEKREELLKDRLRSLQESGGNIPYISVILGSKNFSDLISRSSAVTSIMDQDESIIQEHIADKRELSEKETAVKDKKVNVKEEKKEQEAQKKDLESLKSQLDEQKAKQEDIKQELEEEYEEMEEYHLSLEDEETIIDNRTDALKKARKLAKEEISKIEETNQNQGSHGGSSGNSPGSTSKPDNVGGSGLFSWPASGSLSSGFGPRTSPGGGVGSSNHNGIDISAAKGTAVNAPASGVVNLVNTGCTEGNHSCGGGYGNYIIVTHYINGKTFDTLYGHLSSVNVSNGQSVKQGQRIGGVGHTGSSTGPHLHFEVHPGGYKNPVDPMQYLP